MPSPNFSKVQEPRTDVRQTPRILKSLINEGERGESRVMIGYQEHSEPQAAIPRTKLQSQAHPRNV